MSDPSPDAVAVIAEISQLLFLSRVMIAGAAFVFYDYALTLSTEISEIWNSKFSGAQALFFLMRYSYMVFTVFFCMINLIPNPSKTLCRGLAFNFSTWSIVSEIGLYGILTLRTYAVYQKNRLVLVTLGLTGVAHVAVNVYFEVLTKPEIDSAVFGSSCDENHTSIMARIRLAAVIVSLIFDILVFSLTFTKTIHHAIEMKKVGLGNGLGYFILRDGTMYFLAKLLIGVIGTILFFIPASDTLGSWIGVLTSISHPLTYSITNRLVLNLRQVSHLQERNEPAIGTIQEPAFATNSLLGNLGAPLRVGPDEDDEIEQIGVDSEVEVGEEYGSVDDNRITEEFRDISDV